MIGASVSNVLFGFHSLTNKNDFAAKLRSHGVSPNQGRFIWQLVGVLAT
jgi:hypothetical protein